MFYIFWCTLMNALPRGRRGNYERLQDICHEMHPFHTISFIYYQWKIIITSYYYLFIYLLLLPLFIDYYYHLHFSSLLYTDETFGTRAKGKTMKGCNRHVNKFVLLYTSSFSPFIWCYMFPFPHFTAIHKYTHYDKKEENIMNGPKKHVLNSLVPSLTFSALSFISTLNSRRTFYFTFACHPPLNSLTPERRGRVSVFIPHSCPRHSLLCTLHFTRSVMT